jgi:hypothetical protein
MAQYIEEEIPNILDQSYLTNFESNKEKTNANSIKIFYIYINNNELYHYKGENIELENDCISKERLLFLIKKNQTISDCKHKLVSLLKFDLDIDLSELEDLINNKISTNFLSSLKLLDSITFSNKIPLITDINSIFLIFSTNLSSSNNTTKRIFIKSNSKTKRKRT